MVSTRERLTQEALELFYRQGFRTTTMRQITSTCKLTPAAFYNHFASKDELLYSIIVDSFVELQREIDMELGRSGQTSRERLVAVIKAVTLWHCHKAHQAKVANRESLELPQAMLDLILERRRSLRDQVERIIVAGVESAEFTPTASAAEAARLTSTALFGLMTSISDWYTEPGGWSGELLVDLFVELADRMLGVTEIGLPRSEVPAAQVAAEDSVPRAG
ncbi:TetR/AcrR family transcriptional regulator [Pseudonocardia ailaonensis]|uniref:TetR/AcrR family transcriptional regulator n=1 Tax=Pseudonocardia ailaonensis TaxID=367279 RepID=A0ABN2NH33_9PSEU